jgi:hypothetical protein
LQQQPVSEQADTLLVSEQFDTREAHRVDNEKRAQKRQKDSFSGQNISVFENKGELELRLKTRRLRKYINHVLPMLEVTKREGLLYHQDSQEQYKTGESLRYFV